MKIYDVCSVAMHVIGLVIVGSFAVLVAVSCYVVSYNLLGGL